MRTSSTRNEKSICGYCPSLTRGAHAQTQPPEAPGALMGIYPARHWRPRDDLRPALERHLKRFDFLLTFTEWASLPQDRAGWHKRVIHPPFEIGKPFTRQPRGDTRVTPEEKRRRMAQHKAEIEARRAAFNANAHQALSNS